MKIAFIDNMNNNFFSFLRYLKEFSVEGYLYQIENSSMQHFNVQADTFENMDNCNWIRKFPINISHKNWMIFDAKKIYNEFKGFDLIISCGLSSAYLKRAGIRSDIIIPYGSDLYLTPFAKVNLSSVKSFIQSFFLLHQAYYQRKAYCDEALLIIDNEYELYKNALDKLKLKSENFGIPLLYNKQTFDSKENVDLWGFLKNYDFTVLNHSRQYWRSNEDNLIDYNEFLGAKRNDKLVKAFASYIQDTRFKRPLLILFEYGTDVSETKKLINELNLDSFVKWMPKMNRKNIIYGLQNVTFTSNAFRENLEDIGGVSYEALASGSLHLNNCIKAINNKNHKFYKAPMIHALSENDILRIFKDYEENMEKYVGIANKSLKWFDENLGIGLAKKYEKLFKYMYSSKNNYEIKDMRKIFD